MFDITEHALNRLKWKMKRNSSYYNDTFKRFYVHIPNFHELEGMNEHQLEEACWIIIDLYSLDHLVQSRLRSLPIDKMKLALLSLFSFPPPKDVGTAKSIGIDTSKALNSWILNNQFPGQYEPGYPLKIQQTSIQKYHGGPGGCHDEDYQSSFKRIKIEDSHTAVPSVFNNSRNLTETSSSLQDNNADIKLKIFSIPGKRFY